jgi:hypothetical protein
LHGRRSWGPPEEITRKDGHHPVVICSQLPNNGNKSVTNMAEYLTAEMIEEHGLPMPVVSIEHYPESTREGSEGIRWRASPPGDKSDDAGRRVGG